jgi:ubiquinone/menaquinone biosynthesis C-methylase UbiE
MIPAYTPADKTIPQQDKLWPQLLSLPYFRALLRAVEARFYQDIHLPSPCLDLGCGDGNFAAAAFNRPLEVGLDPWVGPIHKARKSGAYQSLVLANGDQMPFPEGYFAAAVSNSVLEHIPQLDDVLRETHRVLKPGAIFVFCVPNDRFLPNLSIAQGLDRMKMTGLAGSYRSFFNRISRHQHCDSPETWQQRLERAGFAIDRWWHYFSPPALHTLEWGHYFGLPSLVSHAITRRWILVPRQWNLALTHRLVQPFYDETPYREDGTYSFYITHRV